MSRGRSPSSEGVYKIVDVTVPVGSSKTGIIESSTSTPAQNQQSTRGQDTIRDDWIKSRLLRSRSGDKHGYHYSEGKGHKVGERLLQVEREELARIVGETQA
ncbi:1234_t:CDS:2 [Paraglomus occultum]|uniref:1234_t:CDS:1 n=1 Tax=Paraglomus occultum TaxID=144539 RepID=A0A9N9DSA3_9GLOM|nr:1234_t:CDS:2 [Paraglomus occultum]